MAKIFSTRSSALLWHNARLCGVDILLKNCPPVIPLRLQFIDDPDYIHIALAERTKNSVRHGIQKTAFFFAGAIQHVSTDIFQVHVPNAGGVFLGSLDRVSATVQVVSSIKAQTE